MNCNKFLLRFGKFITHRTQYFREICYLKWNTVTGKLKDPYLGYLKVPLNHNFNSTYSIHHPSILYYYCPISSYSFFSFPLPPPLSPLLLLLRLSSISTFSPLSFILHPHATPHAQNFSYPPFLLIIRFQNIETNIELINTIVYFHTDTHIHVWLRIHGKIYIFTRNMIMSEYIHIPTYISNT